MFGSAPAFTSLAHRGDVAGAGGGNQRRLGGGDAVEAGHQDENEQRRGPHAFNLRQELYPVK
jgi:hypothetical protein